MTHLVMGANGREENDATITTLALSTGTGTNAVAVMNFSNASITIEITMNRASGNLVTGDHWIHPEDNGLIPDEVHQAHTSEIIVGTHADAGQTVTVRRLEGLSTVLIPYSGTSTNLQIDDTTSSVNIYNQHGTSSQANDRIYIANVEIS